MRILILGGSGYIGSYLSSYLKGLGNDVLVASRTSGNILVDLTNVEDLHNAFGSTTYDIIINCFVVYSTNLATSMQNVAMTANVIEFFKDRCKHLIFISSVSALDENKNKNVYNFSKYLAEETTKYYMHQGVTNICTLRFAQIIDLEQKGYNIQKGFYSFVNAINNNEPIDVYVKNDSARSYISIELVCESVQYSIDEGVLGFHNVLSGSSLTLKELVTLLLAEKSSNYNNKVTFNDTHEAFSYYIPSSSEIYQNFLKGTDSREYIKKMINK